MWVLKCDKNIKYKQGKHWSDASSFGSAKNKFWWMFSIFGKHEDADNMRVWPNIFIVFVLPAAQRSQWVAVVRGAASKTLFWLNVILERVMGTNQAKY